MNYDANELRNKISLLESDVEIAKQKLRYIEMSCIHKWSDPVADHIYHDSYIIAGDPVGTMGVDWRGPCYVPSKTDKRWKRTCKECGKVEYTTKINESIIQSPKF